MEYWRDDTLFFYFAAFVVLIVCTGNTNGCVFRGNSYEAARLTEDGKKVKVRDSGCKHTLFRPFSIVGPLQFSITND